MKILITGASGFIGRAVRSEALKRGHDVLGMFRRKTPESGILEGSIEEPLWDAIETFAPEAVLHLAWMARPGYLHSDENQILLESSKTFLARCIDLGASQISVAGTCLEYQSALAPLDEQTSPLAPVYPYVRAKMDLWNWLRPEAERQGVTATWFRIFYPYGQGEHEKRLPTLIMRQLAQGKKVELRTPNSIKDYIHITDLADAACTVLERGLKGPVNLGTGNGIMVRDLALKIADAMRVDASLVGDADKLDDDSWPYHVASIKTLNAEGWYPRVSLEQGIEQLLANLNRISS
jgi:nucleoside-diphosphate-sugar epimerase